MPVDVTSSVSDGFSRISHELRSPVVSLHQCLSLLEAGVAGEMNTRQNAYVHRALGAVNDLSRMVDDLLEATRVHTGKLAIHPVAFALDDAVGSMVESYESIAQEAGLTLTLAIESDLPPVHADPGRVRQVIRNLLQNAIKFTPEGGEISVLADRCGEGAEFVRIAVSDTGCGMSSGHAAHVFDYLYQVKGSGGSSNRGLGLGLYICRDLVERQGGEIWAESRAGTGSVFSLTLPVFSPRSLLCGSVLKPHAGAVGPLALTVVDAMPGPEGQVSHLDGLLERIEAVIEGCIMPDRDLLLPRLHASASEPHRCLIVGLTDAAGASVLRDRIRSQLGKVRAIATADLSITVRAAATVPRGLGAEQALRSVLNAIDSIMRTNAPEGCRVAS